MKINRNFLQIKQSYLVSEIGKRVDAFVAQNPDKKVIRMGIGDVTLPLVPAITAALQAAVEEMGKKETFRGYGPEQGYAFLREAIVEDYRAKGVQLHTDEVFVGDGAKSDVGNILDIFDKDNTVLVPNPVYPVYVDTNMMDGRKIIYNDGNEDNGFLPLPPTDVAADIIYLCSPNNPVGVVYNKYQLQQWVDYAHKHGAVILFDAAYETFITDPSLPRSIYEIPGADSCAIEFCSFSKTAGFTGTRCGYTVLPLALCGRHGVESVALNRLWNRRQTTKFNGVSYIVQRGAAAVFSPEGRRQVRESIDYYKQNASRMAETLADLQIPFFGGIDSPYVWMRCPGGMESWDFFDYLMNNIAVVGTPGSGFGTAGEGYFRLTAFGSQEATREAMDRLRTLFARS